MSNYALTRIGPSLAWLEAFGRRAARAQVDAEGNVFDASPTLPEDVILQLDRMILRDHGSLARDVELELVMKAYEGEILRLAEFASSNLGRSGHED